MFQLLCFYGSAFDMNVISLALSIIYAEGLDRSQVKP